jgi:hypothetical protein
VQRLAARRHVTPAHAALAHRLQRTYDHCAAAASRPHAQQRHAAHAQAQPLAAQAAARRDRPSPEGGRGGSSSGGGSSGGGSGGLGPRATVLKAGSHSTAAGGASTVDVWSERAKALRQTSRAHQGRWSEGLSAPLPMIRAGVPGVQRG